MGEENLINKDPGGVWGSLWERASTEPYRSLAPGADMGSAAIHEGPRFISSGGMPITCRCAARKGGSQMLSDLLMSQL